MRLLLAAEENVQMHVPWWQCMVYRCIWLMGAGWRWRGCATHEWVSALHQQGCFIRGVCTGFGYSTSFPAFVGLISVCRGLNTSLCQQRLFLGAAAPGYYCAEWGFFVLVRQDVNAVTEGTFVCKCDQWTMKVSLCLPLVSCQLVSSQPDIYHGCWAYCAGIGRWTSAHLWLNTASVLLLLLFVLHVAVVSRLAGTSW